MRVVVSLVHDYLAGLVTFSELTLGLDSGLWRRLHKQAPLLGIIALQDSATAALHTMKLTLCHSSATTPLPSSDSRTHMTRSSSRSRTGVSTCSVGSVGGSARMPRIDSQ